MIWLKVTCIITDLAAAVAFGAIAYGVGGYPDAARIGAGVCASICVLLLPTIGAFR